MWLIGEVQQDYCLLFEVKAELLMAMAPGFNLRESNKVIIDNLRFRV